MKNVPIGEILIENGSITKEQLNDALEYQKTHKDVRMGGALMALGYVTEKQMLEALAVRRGLKLTDLKRINIDQKAVAMLPRQLATKYNLIPVGIRNNKLVVVMSDPLNFYAIEDVSQITHMPLDILLDIKQNITDAISVQYSEVDAKAVATKVNESAGTAQLDEKIEIAENGNTDEAPVVQMLNSLLIRGYRTNASDIHIEPFETKISVRMRIDGVITDYVTLSAALKNPLVARIKILSGLDIAERRLPQDGHMKMMIDGEEVNARVSVIPTVYGEKTVIRFLAQNVAIDNAGTFGMTAGNFKKFSHMLQSPHGIVYITGPTGSGKTTTLYMVLEQIAKRSVNISTIEDPVERNIDRVNQVQVNNVSGLTFEVGLRSLLRQDPDVIMVGETRDSETAEISVRAAITGHQVFSTLHTNDALSSIVRLKDMGIPAYMVANSVVGLVAQRLMRKVCDNCKEAYEPGPEDIKALGRDVDRVYRGRGCPMCNGTGYRGRTAVHEVVLIDSALRRMIASDGPIDDIYDYVAKHQDFQSLRQSAADLVEAGISTMEEFHKVAYYSD